MRERGEEAMKEGEGNGGGDRERKDALTIEIQDLRRKEKRMALLIFLPFFFSHSNLKSHMKKNINKEIVQSFTIHNQALPYVC